MQKEKSSGYRKIAGVLSGAILDGRFGGGKNFPSRREIAASFSVSGQTAQRALKLLERNKWISCARGRRARIVFPFSGPPERTGRRPLTFLLVCPDTPSAGPWQPEIRARLKVLIRQTGNRTEEVSCARFSVLRTLPEQDAVCIIPALREIAPALYQAAARLGKGVCGCSLVSGPDAPLCVSVHSCMTDMALFLMRRKVRFLTVFDHVDGPVFGRWKQRILNEVFEDCACPLSVRLGSLPDLRECSFRRMLEEKIRESRAGALRTPPALFFSDPVSAELCRRSAENAGWKCFRDYILIGCCAEAEEHLCYPVIDAGLDNFCRSLLKLGFELAARPEGVCTSGAAAVHVPRFRAPDSEFL